MMPNTRDQGGLGCRSISFGSVIPPETWAELIENPGSRRSAISDLARSTDGNLEDMRYSFGEQYGCILIDALDNVSAASGGATMSIQTDVLLTVEETLEALKKAQSVAYVRLGG